MARREPHDRGNFFHVYNRGAGKCDIFKDASDYQRFLVSLRVFNTTRSIESIYRLKQLHRSYPVTPNEERLVEILAYCLLPNHFHVLIGELHTSGIAQFMHKLQKGYSRYFNCRYERSGVLFQGSYQGKKIVSEPQLAYASAYVNGNAQIHGYSEVGDWPWSSFLEYSGMRHGTLPSREPIISLFPDRETYCSYIAEVASMARKRKAQIMLEQL